MQPLAIRILYVALIAFFAPLGLFLSSATVSYASSSASDEVPFLFALRLRAGARQYLCRWQAN